MMRHMPNMASIHALEAGLPSFSSIRIVSLQSRSDRREHMHTLTSFLQLHNVHFQDAVLYSDPRVQEIVQRVGNNTKADKKIPEVGHVACRMSHRLAIQAADADEDQVTLILEGTHAAHTPVFW
jgi:GR25 family glycosyltransferase involved in LPS biosynthesis